MMVAFVGLLCLSLRLATARWAADAGDAPIFWTHLRLDSLAFGVLLAHWRASRPAAVDGWARPRRCKLVLAGSLCLAPAFVFPVESSWWIRTFGFTFNYVGAGALLMACIDLGAGKAPSRLWGAAAWLGGWSYPIYVWHMEVVLRVYKHLHLESGWSVWWTAGVSIIASLCFGVVFGRLVEWPVLKWRDRFFPSRSGGGRAIRTATEES
jgi:peptidoglycan/LPS O-acetylase OafA/YrhL